jgi:hypothetical protein
MDVSRRDFIRRASGVIVFPAIVRATSLMPVKALADGIAVIVRKRLPSGLWYEELQMITRKAFTPALYTQIYDVNPVMSGFLNELEKLRAAKVYAEDVASKLLVCDFGS